jgi:hypothetical protein
MSKQYIYLSSAHSSFDERKYLFDNVEHWIGFVGKNVGCFESDLEYYLDENRYVAALTPEQQHFIWH